MLMRNFFLIPLIILSILTVNLACAFDCHSSIWSEEGTYDLPGIVDGELLVFVNDENTIQLSVRIGEKTVCSLDTGASQYHRWLFEWEKSHRYLCFYSGDIGTYIFIWNDSDKTLNRRSVVTLEINEYPLPKYFKDELPKSTLEALNNRRKTTAQSHHM